MDLTKTANAQSLDSTRWTEIRGNTGGLGGAFAFFMVLAALFLSRGKPYKRSLQRRILEGATGIANRFKE
jgi:hypothetical protein